MKNARLLAEKKAIDGLFAHIDAFSGDIFDKSLLTYYLCIRVSGFLENCVRIIFSEYSNTRTKDHVTTYVNKKLQKFPNPTHSSIAGIAKDFNDTWAVDYKKTTTKKLRDSLESINANRNQIAHGGSSTITLTELQQYYNDAVQIIENLENACV